MTKKRKKFVLGHKCSKCDKNFKHITNLNIHWKKKHYNRPEDKAGVKDIPKEVLNRPWTLLDNLGVAPRTVEEIAWEIWQKVKTIQAHEKMHQVFGHNWRSVTQIDDADKTPPCDCGCQVSNPVKKRKWKVVISFDIPIHSAKEPLDEQVAREVRTHLLNNVPDFLENFVDECDWDILPEDDA